MSSLNRRRFLHVSAAGATLLPAFTPRRLFGAPDPATLYAQFVPADKTLDPAWVQSLTTRGHALDRGITGDKQSDTLKYIGMTVGGICCGSVYLNGDGQLFVWDIFNQHHEGIVAQNVAVPAGMQNISKRPVRERDGANYVSPPTPESHPPPFRQGFGLRIGKRVVPLDASGWDSVSFTGKWPVGEVRYRDPSVPVAVDLRAYSPFIPGQLDDSSLPLTAMEYTVKNTSKQPVEAALLGWLENTLGIYSQHRIPMRSASTWLDESGFAGWIHQPSIEPEKKAEASEREDIPFADFEDGTYQGWTAEGEAFGAGPIARDQVPDYQGNLQMHGKFAVNSHATAPGTDIGSKDAKTGTLISPEFKITRKYISLLVGGGSHKGRTCVQLVIGDRVVAEVTGRSDNAMTRTAMHTTRHEGQTARLRVIDNYARGWGNISLDHVVFTDTPPVSDPADQRNQPDYGSMMLAVLGDAKSDSHENVPGASVSLRLQPGESRTVTFLISWHFANMINLGKGKHTHYYASRFEDAAAVMRHATSHWTRLREGTMRWVETWNDSTLPQWLLDRTILTTNTLQTANCLRWEDGRVWCWEGVGCCPGTCNHVWHYAQGAARLFPEFERNLREKTDFAVAQNSSNGGIGMRAEWSHGVAIDGQSGVVLRAYREHQCSTDGSFLQQNWKPIRLALQFLIDWDKDFDGLLEGSQHNTLDANWWGKVHCLCSLYLAALQAGVAMAQEMDDADFAQTAQAILDKGRKNIEGLFNGEFYEQELDPAHLDAIGVGKGCFIDQVIGQYWAFQVGLGRLYNEDQIRSTLQSLWKYNVLTDVGPFRQQFKRGRFYAINGDGGLLMCTWPKGGLRDDFTKHWQYAYFNECMTGFEYQVAAHMVAEGTPDLVEKGLAITRLIHDRYAPDRRNPYNEIECSDHYARAMSSYGVYISTCGFEYHGPDGVLGFAPRLRPENFKAAFTGATGFGTFAQRLQAASKQAEITLRHGALRLTEIRLPWLGDGCTAALNGQALSGKAGAKRFVLRTAVELKPGDVLSMRSA